MRPLHILKWLNKATPSTWMMITTVVSQGGLLAAIPFITRTYAANTVAFWSIVISWVNLLWSFSQLKTDQALVQAPDHREAGFLYYFGLLTHIILCTIILFVSQWLNIIESWTDLWWIFFAVFFHGWHQMNLSWLVAGADFRKLAVFRSGQILLSYPGALALWYFLKDAGLVGAFCFGNIIFIIIFYLQEKTPPFPQFKAGFSIKNLLIRHRSTMTYLAAGNLFLSIADQALVISIARLIDPVTAAAYFLAARVCSLPVTFMQSSFGQLNLKKYQDLYLNNQLTPEIPIRFWKQWFAVGGLYYLPIIVLGPQLFAILLGQQWHFAGSIAVWLAAAAWVRFLSNPTSMIFFIIGKTKVFFVFTVLLGLNYFLCILLINLNIPFFNILIATTLVQITILLFYNLFILKLM